MTTVEQYPGLDYFHEQPNQESVQTLRTYLDEPCDECDETVLFDACWEFYYHIDAFKTMKQIRERREVKLDTKEVTPERYPGLDYFHEQPDQEAVQTLRTYLDEPWAGCDETELLDACQEVYGHVAERGRMLHDWKHRMSDKEYNAIRDDTLFYLSSKAHGLIDEIETRRDVRAKQTTE